MEYKKVEKQIEKLLKEGNEEKLIKYVRENPGYLLSYNEGQEIIIKKALMTIRYINNVFARALTIDKDDKTN
jgi:hypothetical protein